MSNLRIHEINIHMFEDNAGMETDYQTCLMLSNNSFHKGPWELKMRSMTNRVYVDDIEADDGIVDNDPFDTNQLATAARVGTSLRTATSVDSKQGVPGSRPRTSTGRPLTGMARPGTISQRPGSSMKSRTSLGTGSRSGSAKNIRLGSASMFVLGDPTGSLFQSSQLNPTRFVEKDSVSKQLFQFLYYHEGDIKKALDLCEAIIEHKKKGLSLMWWYAQRGRCYLALGKPRDAEPHLKISVVQLPHPDTALLLSRVYVKIDQPLAALKVISDCLEKLPNDVSLLTQQGRIFELMNNLQASARMYRHIAQLEPINTEALSCIAVHHFYGNQPEMALIYYRRILSMGAHSCELYCNLGLCCLYGGQLDLVLPCFQRALRLAITSEQRADVWYNVSFVALTSGDFNLAKRCLRLCISSDGSHGAALNNLAVLAMKSGHRDKAQSYFAAAKNVLADSDEVKHNQNLFEKRD
ncbi:Tetratricopeptide repeat protein 8 [Pseudolycoriella hygida]|uniref:Tetratricopeptide repeat protein 8 n=1 Tax=Pseudolycoriella hygida TaxID=35572 RepID=A0A9Q0NGJ0_9DIPT|nr:Tetratricopeptide repeat protein 8 [Pseudolycoriella hygida]